MDRIVMCPCCKKHIAYSTDNPHRPFCSERCRLVDLGQWFAEGYRIAQEDDRPGAADGACGNAENDP